MMGSKTTRIGAALVILAFSMFIMFEDIGGSTAVKTGTAISPSSVSVKSLQVRLDPLGELKSALANLMNKNSSKEDAALSEAVSNQSIEDQTIGDQTAEDQTAENDYSVLVRQNGSNILVEDKKGNVISKRQAGSDDAAAIKESINLIDSGTILCIGTFHILSPIDNLKSDIQLKGIPGQTVFDCSKMKTTVIPCGCDGSGYAGATALLIEDAPVGSRTVKVADAIGYSDGDFVKLVDNENITGFKKGEILRIQNINNNEIVFDEPVRDDYTVANAANIRKLSMAEDITIDGIKFTGPGLETDLSLLGLNLLTDFRFANNEVANFGRAAIYLSDSLGSVIENNSFENIYMTGFGYAVAVTNACDDIYIKDNIFRVKGRHYISTGAGTGSRSSGGFVRNIKILNNTFENCIQEAVNTHPPFIGPIEIIGNRFISDGKGIEISNGNTVIVDNIFTKCPIGIQLLGDEDRTHMIRSNEFKDYEKKIIIETKNMTVYGNICNGEFRVHGDEIEFM
jgi:hypothetical protein